MCVGLSLCLPRLLVTAAGARMSQGGRFSEGKSMDLLLRSVCVEVGRAVSHVMFAGALAQKTSKINAYDQHIYFDKIKVRILFY